MSCIHCTNIPVQILIEARYIQKRLPFLWSKPYLCHIRSLSKRSKKCILKLLFIVLALCCCCKFKWRIKYEILEFISQSQMKGECYFFSPLSLNFPKPRLFSLRIGSTYYLQAIHIYVLFNSVQLFKDHQIKISLFFKNNLRKYICHDLRYFSGLFVYYFFLLWMLLEEKVIFSQPDEVTVTLK